MSLFQPTSSKISMKFSIYEKACQANTRRLGNARQMSRPWRIAHSHILGECDRSLFYIICRMSIKLGSSSAGSSFTESVFCQSMRMSN